MIDRGTIERWLREADVPLEEVELEDPDLFAWHLAYRGKPYVVVVTQYAVDWTHIGMEVSLGVSPGHQAMLRSLDADTRDRFFLDLRILLLQQPVGHMLEFEGEEEDRILSRMTFGVNVFDAGLTKSGFFRRNHQLQSVALLAVQMVRKLERFKRWE